MTDPVLRMTGLRAASGTQVLVDDVDLEVFPGECVALVGPSGSGKTVTARAALGLSAPGLRVSASSLIVAGRDVRSASERTWRSVRGKHVGYVGQEALGALDPLRPVAREIGDALRLHTELTASERVARVREALERVGLDPDLASSRTLAGELSGGMRQRALIAAATVADPELIVADEPTTALDAGIALTVMEEIRAAQLRGTAVLMITHDRALVTGWADRVVEIRGGRIVPESERTSIIAVSHPNRGEVPPATGRVPPEAAPVLHADDLSARFGDLAALNGVGFSLVAGRTLGVVGASGSGKTTLTRVLLGLQEPSAGTVTLDGAPWAPLREAARRTRRGRIAAVVQDPGATFDDRWDVTRVLADALTGGREYRVRAGSALDARVDGALERVGLSPSLRPRSPRTLSGGQRQRLAIARALATEPDVLVLDEPVTALDADVQNTVLTLLERLRDDTAVAMVFVSHDLEAVRRMADDVLVIADGRVVESGPTEDVFERPQHPVTAELVLRAQQLAVGPLRYS
jgi:peptide/nickel transport system ATP-binding protein